MSEIFIISYLVLFVHFTSRAQNEFSPLDKQIFDLYMGVVQKNESVPVGELLAASGNFLSGTPYVAHTLEVPGDEHLVVNLREFDCTTFVESVLALSLTAQSDDRSFEAFCRKLQYIRYRDGLIDGYPSRLHYFSDWIDNNQKKGILRDVTKQCGGQIFSGKTGFMSAHPENYSPLSTPEFLARIKEQEAIINSRTHYYIPKTSVNACTPAIETGDIIAITSGIAGLDILHTGLALKKEGRLYLLHASSKAQKVTVTAEPLQDYLAASKSQTGIMVARVTEPQ